MGCALLVVLSEHEDRNVKRAFEQEVTEIGIIVD